jgi:hypothetical protein
MGGAPGKSAGIMSIYGNVQNLHPLHVRLTRDALSHKRPLLIRNIGSIFMKLCGAIVQFSIVIFDILNFLKFNIKVENERYTHSL